MRSSAVNERFLAVVQRKVGTILSKDVFHNS